jgi:phosphotransferase system enzyme I (PtsP)
MHRCQEELPDLPSPEINDMAFTPDDFEKALKKTEKHLETLQERVEEKLSDAASLIFASHLLMLKDRGFTGGMRELIRSGEKAPAAILKIFTKYRNLFAGSANPLIREKTQDIEDLTRRILNNLVNRESDSETCSGHIIIARELFPSELLTLSVENIAGLILVSGGVTSHVGILARSLRIPLVIISDSQILDVPEGTMALVDADTGNVYINPTQEVISNFTMKEKASQTISASGGGTGGPVSTADGTPVSVMLNINLLSDLKQIDIGDIDGVGLYRTEFPFMIRGGFPSEEEQYVIYRKLAKGLEEKPLTIRTLDIGGDKVLSYYDFPKEDNPFLGMRSIRFSLQHEDIFRQQIRAILRAGSGADLKIMFPMISSLDEFISARNIVYRCMDELSLEGLDYNAEPSIGMMVEIPSAVTIIDDLAEEADFFSVGTNDLIQYTLAVDRTNEKVSSMYIPHHPSVLRSLKLISDAAKKAGIEVSVCGDMANREIYIPFLLGIGIRALSVDAMYIPRVKRRIRKTGMAEAVAFSARLLSGRRIEEIESILGQSEEGYG